MRGGLDQAKVKCLVCLSLSCAGKLTRGNKKKTEDVKGKETAKGLFGDEPSGEVEFRPRGSVPTLL